MGFFDEVTDDVKHFFGMDDKKADGAGPGSAQAPGKEGAAQPDPTEVQRATEDLQTAQRQLKQAQDELKKAQDELKSNQEALQKAQAAQQQAAKQKDDAQHFDTTDTKACQKADGDQRKADQATQKAQKDVQQAQKQIEMLQSRRIPRLQQEIDQNQGIVQQMQMRLENAKKGKARYN